VTLTEPLDNRGMRRHYVRRRSIGSRQRGGWRGPAGAQGAGVLSSLSRADGLLVVPEHVERAEPGMRFEAILFDWAVDGGSPS
jgi:molybdopterin biosynthesis enzyme